MERSYGVDALCGLGGGGDLMIVVNFKRRKSGFFLPLCELFALQKSAPFIGILSVGNMAAVAV